MSSDVITPSQLAREWDLTYDTVINLINLGELPFFKVGRQWRCRRADLNQHIAKRLPEKFTTVVKPKFYHKDQHQYGG